MPNSNHHRGLLIVLSGPSAVGKSTIGNRLEEDPGVIRAVSKTTRTERPGDDKGKKYEYVGLDEFYRKLDADQFLEYAQVYDNYYGTPKHPALDDLSAGKDVLLDIDVQGALQVRYSYPDALLIFILPPDEPTLLERLKGRARDPEDDITRRFRAAKREIHMAKGSRAFDHMVINDDLDRAVAEIRRLIANKKTGAL
ncbi:MAG TPA: guanylate kinase [Tepidisphaeraceae bacterium]|jgi:guanylate kinase|nr:guanylate kinase [Tepidisphaeraceae bacterium]